VLRREYSTGINFIAITMKTINVLLISQSLGVRDIIQQGGVSWGYTVALKIVWQRASVRAAFAEQAPSVAVIYLGTSAEESLAMLTHLRLISLNTKVIVVFEAVSPALYKQASAAGASDVLTVAEFDALPRAIYRILNLQQFEADLTAGMTTPTGASATPLTSQTATQLDAQVLYEQGISRSLFVANLLPMMIVDVDTLYILEVNDAAVAKYGFARNEFHRMTMYDVSPPEEAKLLRAYAMELKGRGLGFRIFGEQRQRLKNRTIIDTEITSHTIEFQGRLAAHITIFDVTDSKKAKSDVALTEQRYRAIVETQTDLIGRITPDGALTFANEALCRFIGKPIEELSGFEINQRIHPDDHAAVAMHLRSLSPDQPTGRISVRMFRADGQVSWYQWVNQAIYDEQGNLQDIQGIGRDITEAIRLEYELRASEEKYRGIVETAQEGLWSVDQNVITTHVNQKMTDMLGYESDEMLRKPFMAFVHPDDQSDGASDHAGFAAIREDRDVRLLRKDGKIVWAIVSTLLNSDANGAFTGGLAMVTDITARKQALEAAQQSARRIEILRQLDLAIMRADSVQIVAQIALDALHDLIPCRSAIVASIDSQARTGTCLAAWYAVRPVLLPGQSILIQPGEYERLLNVDYHMSRIDGDQIGGELGQATKANNIHAVLFIPLKVDSIVVGTLQLTEVHADFFDAEYIAIAQEIARPIAIAMRQAELNQQVRARTHELEQRVEERTQALRVVNDRLEIALRQQQELSEMKSRFVSMVSQEYRTPLATILMITESLSAYRARMTTAQIDTRLQKVINEISHMTEIIDRVLQLSRIQAGRVEFKPVLGDLGQLCSDIIETFLDNPALKHKLAFTYTRELAPHDPRLMWQVITNLISNALKYTPEGKGIFVDVTEDSDQVVLSVRDEGIGIPAADLPRLFEPFYRASNTGQIPGAGLGLSITKNAVELHGGTITVASEVGKGTTFTVSLPGRV